GRAAYWICRTQSRCRGSVEGEEEGGRNMAQGEKVGVEELHILWLSEGMSGDGDSLSITAASQPSLEDIVLGVVPGIPKVHLHNKVLAYETGEDFLAAFRHAARGELAAVL